MGTQQPRSIASPDIDELLQTGESVVLAVDQVPFDVESRGVTNIFCLLVPLLTENGVPLEREQFHNRERVWWMLRSDIHPEEIRVGMIWSAPIERSREYHSHEPEKDHYQARRSDIRPGVRRFVEVLNHKVTHPDLNALLGPQGFPWPYPPLGRVVVRGGLSVVGPFRTQYDYERGRLHLAALTPGTPTVYRLPRAEFEAETDLHEFSYTANRWDGKAQERRIDITLMHERDLTLLERDAERLDGASEAQVVKWALDLMEIPKKDRQLYRDVLVRAGELETKAEVGRFPGRLERFLALSESRQRIIDLGNKVAETVASKEGFRELVDLHIDTVSEERVSEAIAGRREEIERQTAEAEGRLERLNERVAGAQEEYQTRLEAWEREFEERNHERITRLDERERALEHNEKVMVERLEGLAKTYRDDAQRLGDEIVAQLPLLQRLGLITAGGDGTGTARAHRLELPSYLETAKERGEIDEEGFLRQFEIVTASHGFVFEREDLVNFHVLVKTGIWTILSGPSGRGKSSLPRLYAKALGWEDEYLIVPVRPDWLDDRDVIGSFNALSGRYEPSPCGLVDRLITAHEDAKRGRGGLYVVCLDEMNLARVEHYFAQFLSQLEQPEAERHLKLWSRGVGSADDPYSPYRRLPLGANLRFVGTVNVDETTHFFSPKVIDRAPIVTFDDPDLRLGLDTAEESPAAVAIEPVHVDVYASWIRPLTTSGEPVDLLLQVDQLLRSSRLGLGFRLRDRILRYVGSAHELVGEDPALDLALLQNVVPRLRPTAPRYTELLAELQKMLPPGRFRRTAEALKALAEDPESDYFQLL